MAGYNWQQQDWPNFKYNASKADEWLFTLAEKTATTPVY